MKTAKELANTRNWTNYTALELVQFGRTTPEEATEQLIQSEQAQMAKDGIFPDIKDIKSHLEQWDKLESELLELLQSVA